VQGTNGGFLVDGSSIDGWFRVFCTTIAHRNASQATERCGTFKPHQIKGPPTVPPSGAAIYRVAAAEGTRRRVATQTPRGSRTR
jgi:hypothetical protein